MILVVTILGVFMLGTLHKMECCTVHSTSSHSIPQCKLYWDPGKGEAIVDCRLTTYCLFSMFFQFL